MSRSKNWGLRDSGVYCISQVSTFSSTRLAFLVQDSVAPNLCCDKADTNTAQRADTSPAVRSHVLLGDLGKSADKQVLLGQESFAEAGEHSWHHAAEDSTFQFFALPRRKLSVTTQMCSQLRLLSNSSLLKPGLHL